MKQKYLHKPGLFFFLAILGMVAPLSTDLYLPALPEMSTELNTTTSAISLTLVVFNVFLAIGILIFGSFSDKFGRKWPLFISIGLYGLGSLSCACATDIVTLILARCLQSFGAGGMVSIPLAIIKDVCTGKTRGRILSVVQSFTVVAPIIAPLLGSVILNYGSWRNCFFVLVLFAVGNLVLCLLYKETIPKEEILQGSFLEPIKHIFIVGKNKSFMLLLLVAAMFMACFFAYLSVASYVYEDFYSLSNTEFSIYFAINAGVSLFGPVVCIFIGHKVKCITTVNMTFIVSAIVIALLFTFGQTSAIGFLVSFAIFGITNSFLRPYITNILLGMNKRDAGSASGLINFVFTIVGAVGMFVGALPWPNYISGIAFSMIIFVSVALLIWVFSHISKSIKFDDNLKN